MHIELWIDRISEWMRDTSRKKWVSRWFCCFVSEFSLINDFPFYPSGFWILLMWWGFKALCIIPASFPSWYKHTRKCNFFLREFFLVLGPWTYKVSIKFTTSYVLWVCLSELLEGKFVKVWSFFICGGDGCIIPSSSCLHVAFFISKTSPSPSFFLIFY